MAKNRKDYSLTDETRKVIGNHYDEIADEFGSVGRYIYGIIYEENPDPYAYFRHWYASCVRSANVNHCIYDEDMAQIRNKYRNPCPSDSREYLLNKIETDSDSTKAAIEAFADGVLTREERLILRGKLESMRQSCDALERIVNDSPDEMSKEEIENKYIKHPLKSKRK